MHYNYPLADLEVLNMMANDTSNEVMPAMIQVYCNELSSRRDLLRAATINNDTTEISEQAHAIKSSSGTFGAKRLREYAKSLESAANKQESERTEINQLAETVQSILSDTITEYRQCMKRF